MTSLGLDKAEYKAYVQEEPLPVCFCWRLIASCLPEILPPSIVFLTALCCLSLDLSEHVFVRVDLEDDPAQPMPCFS